MNACQRLVKDYSLSKDHLPGQSLPWLTAMRENALENFLAQGLPDARDENWKYTKIKQLEQLNYDLAQPVASSVVDSLSAPVLGKWRCPGQHRLVFINGCYNESLSSIGQLPEGTTLSSFAQALAYQPELVASAVGKTASYQQQAFTALNTALMSDGVFLLAAENTKIAAPIHCLFISTATGQPVVSYPRLVLVLQNNAELTLVEHYIDASRPDSEIAQPGLTKTNRNLTNAVTEIRLAPQARMEHYKLQYESVHSSHISAMYVEQQRASRFTSHSYSLGAALARHDIQVKLAESQAACSLNGVYLVDGRQHVDYHTQIEHLAPGCNSQQVYKGVIQGRARAVFNGKVVIHSSAQQSNARQLNKNLLLGDKGEVDTKPELQIYADDVICSHGATVGQLDTKALFYLQSRGVSEKDALAWLVYGFVSEVLEQISNPVMRKFILDPVIEQLNQLVGSGATNWHELFSTERGEMSCQ